MVKTHRSHHRLGLVNDADVIKIGLAESRSSSRVRMASARCCSRTNATGPRPGYVRPVMNGCSPNSRACSVSGVSLGR